MEQVMMIDPHDRDHKETEQIAEELRGQAAQGGEGGIAGDFELQHHDGDDDGDHAVTESFEPIGAHGV
jgi:hypothetical protein